MGDGRVELTGVTERFAVSERLGAGGMGVVYRARDVARDLEVALKILRRVDGGAIYRFKREFRTLAELAHPNLISLYELMSDGDEWFFTMELIDGVGFLEHVRPFRHLIMADPMPPAL